MLCCLIIFGGGVIVLFMYFVPACSLSLIVLLEHAVAHALCNLCTSASSVVLCWNCLALHFYQCVVSLSYFNKLISLLTLSCFSCCPVIVILQWRLRLALFCHHVHQRIPKLHGTREVILHAACVQSSWALSCSGSALPNYFEVIRLREMSCCS